MATWRLQQDTYTSYALVRSNLKSHRRCRRWANSIAYGKRVKLWPAVAANPPETVFIDVKDVDYDSTIRYDGSSFTSLNRIVQSEPGSARPCHDRSGSAALIKKIVQSMRKCSRSSQPLLVRKIWKKNKKGFPRFSQTAIGCSLTLQEAMDGQGTTYANQDKYAIDARGLLTRMTDILISGWHRAVLSCLHPDKDGKSFDGANTYRLRVPPNAR